MSFIKNFRAFLNKINIDYDKYADCTLTDANGNKYLFSQINKKNILNFDWAYFLAQNNEIILLNNSQDTLESLKLFNELHSGMLGVRDKYFLDAIEECYVPLFEDTKDMYCFMRYMYTGVMRDKYVYMYFEDGSPDNFLICLATVKKKTSIFPEEYTRDAQKAARKVGLHMFPLCGYFPRRQIHSLENIPMQYHDRCFIDGITVPKNHYNKDRNASLIAELNTKRREQRRQKLDFVMSEEDDEKYTKKAKKLYDEIKIYGLEHISREKPELDIENYLVQVFKILLYKKWAAYKNIAVLESECSIFFHMFDDGGNIPDKEDLIFDIIDYIDEYVQPD